MPRVSAPSGNRVSTSKRPAHPGVDRRVVRRHRRPAARGPRRGRRAARRTERRGWRPPSRPARRRWRRRGRAERGAEPSRVGVRRLAALEPVPAHHPDQVPPVDPGVEREVDRVVVQRPGERRLRVRRRAGPGVGARIERRGVRVGVVELGRRCRARCASVSTGTPGCSAIHCSRRPTISSPLTAHGRSSVDRRDLRTRGRSAPRTARPDRPSSPRARNQRADVGAVAQQEVHARRGCRPGRRPAGGR